MVPEVRYAANGDTTLAWTSIGAGPIDVLVLLGGISHVEQLWEEPGLARYFEHIAAFARVILMDRRGVGLSDPVSGPITLDDECADVDAVLDAAGSRRAVMYGYTWGGPLAIHYAHTRPERVRALVLYACVATTLIAAEDFDRELDHSQREAEMETSLRGLGDGCPDRGRRALARRRRASAGMVRPAHADVVESRRDAHALAQHLALRRA